TLARIIHLVERAQAQRAPSQTFVERFAAIYTPAVIVLAVGLALVPPLALHGTWQTWLYRALVLLVVSCPCALVISTPVSIVAALAGAARKGVLIKGGVHLEHTSTVRCVAFDKTGTLTRGTPEVVDLVPLDGMEAHGRTAVLVARAGRTIGIIAVADRPRETAKDAIDLLRAQGIARIVMLTGDSRGTAQAIAAELGVDEVRAELLPEDKV